MKPRKPISRQEKIEIALFQFEYVKKNGKWPSLKELRDNVCDRSSAVLSRAFKAAIEEGLVELREVARPSKPPQRNAELENKLLSRFKDLRAAIVIRGDSRSTAPRPRLSQPDDELHVSLGEAMAQYLGAASLFRDGDVIAVGSGRGVKYTIQAMRKVFPLPFRVEVALISLTGSVHSRNVQERFWLDADIHAALLGTCFDREIKLNLIRHPLTYRIEPNETSSGPKRRDLRARTPLSEEQWRQCHPTHALVGVGILAPGHRFYVEAMGKPEEQEPLLEPIHNQLVELVKLCKQYGSTLKGVPSLVADISNHLIFIPPPAGATLSTKAQENIKRLIATINETMITVQFDQLASIQNLMLIAGTENKAPAIRELLTNDSQYHVRYLCTDESAANRILEEG